MPLVTSCKIRQSNSEDLDDIFDLLHYRSLSPLDQPLSDVTRKCIGMKVYAAGDQDIYFGVLTDIDEDSNIAVLENNVEALLSSCVLIN